MPDYRRAYCPGGTFFFTLVTERRAPFLCTDLARSILHNLLIECARCRPFAVHAIVLLPDHLHTIWTLPGGDADFSTRLAFIKARFTSQWLAAGGREQPRTGSRLAQRRRGVWQRRFWEHCMRDENDFASHLNYLHFNPVKHGVASCPHAWPHSTFQKWVATQNYEADWGCSCDSRVVPPLDFRGIDQVAVECGE